MTAPLRVLVVDDDFMVARVHRRFVELVPGFEVVGEARTREVARLLSGHPDRAEALDHARVLLEG